LQTEKIRIFALARELDMESKDLLTLCRQNGIDVKNQLSTLEPEVREQVVQLVRRGSAGIAPTTTQIPGALPTSMNKLRDLNQGRGILSRRASSAPAGSTGPAGAETPSEKALAPGQEPSKGAATPPEPPQAGAPSSLSPTEERGGKEGRAETSREQPASGQADTRASEGLGAEPPTTSPDRASASTPEGVKDDTRKHPPGPKERSPDKSGRPGSTEAIPPRRAAEVSSPEKSSEEKAVPGPRDTSRPAGGGRQGPEGPPGGKVVPHEGEGARQEGRNAPHPDSPRPGPGGLSGHPGGQRPMRDLAGGRQARVPEGDAGVPPRPPGPRGEGPARKPRDRKPPRPGEHFKVAQPPTPRPLSKPHEEKDKKKPTPPSGAKRIGDIPEDLLQQGGAVRIEDILRRQHGSGKAAPVPPVPDDEEEEGGAGKKDKKRKAVPGRDARRSERAARQMQRRSGQGDRKGGIALVEDEEGPRRDRSRRRLKQPQPGTKPRKGKVPITLPITVRSLSEAIGVKGGALLFALMNHGCTSLNINSTLDPEVAEALALEHDCELDIKRHADAEELLTLESQKADSEEDLVPRAPIVTVMGHVDHGKTSLLDRIRKSNVVDTEAGGITQVIRAWRVDHKGSPITFLDTPGHEAFTQMRARGANVTDIAVIVVAADDGVMPQTEEAISHAKAADVSIVLAINKVDVPNANLGRTKQQLYGLGLIPDDMGGEVPFVETSAVTGQGIDDLLENLAVVAELKELKANPNKPAQGVCLEAYLSEKQGVLATILVRDGTLRLGDVVLCGPAHGTVRKMYDDLGRVIEEAGPSVPVRITGLDVVPEADDPFHVVPDLATAREVAEKRLHRQQEASLQQRQPVSLETLSEAQIAELKVILKAEARGSIEAIRAELEKLQHEEVRVRLLHSGIGAINVSDVQLALTSPQDTIVVGFNVVPDDAALALAEERGIRIQEYDIIYKLTEDLRAALEGKLKPREEIIHLGRAVVRETFKISRVGTIAGCYVTQGTIERSAKVRVIRGGVVVYPPPERTAGLESLKRFKDDVREVREGFECGMKIAGYDDIKTDDIIEAYRIEQVQRKLT
jgi:translation initiation factor IF-2